MTASQQRFSRRNKQHILRNGAFSAVADRSYFFAATSDALFAVAHRNYFLVAITDVVLQQFLTLSERILPKNKKVKSSKPSLQRSATTPVIT